MHGIKKSYLENINVYLSKTCIRKILFLLLEDLKRNHPERPKKEEYMEK